MMFFFSTFSSRFIYFLLSALTVGLCLTSCYKEKFTTDPNDVVTFSTDTLSFDTVLTSISTVTRYFKVYNPNNLSIEIEEIKLTGEHAGLFRLNVDGMMGDVIRNITIRPNDSIYVFAEATIDPDQPESISPFVIESEIEFTTNGNSQKVLMIAWGQNANYIPGPHTPNRISILTCDLGEELWDDPKPYVLYGTLLIDSCTLVLPPGTRLYVHGGIANNQIGIYNEGLIYTLPHGRINALGTVTKPVIIRDDRIEPDHEGEWAGIRLGPESGPHQFSHCILTSGIVGISSDSASNVSIDHCVIAFTGGPGFFGRHSSAKISNSLFYENGTQSVALTYGGNYEITYCTMANFGNDREALLMNNFFCSDLLCTEGTQINKLDALVRNSIIVGSSSDELWMVDAFDPAGEMFDVTMQNNIVVVEDLLDSDNYPAFFETICSNCFEWMFSDTLFVDMNKYDYHLDTASVAEMKAIPIPGFIDDLDGNLRDVLLPDIGCYEFQ
ncbi:MAG TPA: right-handed parallel beta-helix repeat-containing protein [Saprospiraceae bacterium]|nr:right-handed parallel beta-helix repeat-containing protein [Saprospiraceae bacterium]